MQNLKEPNFFFMNSHLSPVVVVMNLMHGCNVVNMTVVLSSPLAFILRFVVAIHVLTNPSITSRAP